ncbi:MAG: hypothetical protein WC184_05990 [Acidimicrobiia bacterium]
MMMTRAKRDSASVASTTKVGGSKAKKTHPAAASRVLVGGLSVAGPILMVTAMSEVPSSSPTSSDLKIATSLLDTENNPKVVWVGQSSSRAVTQSKAS